MLSFIFSRLKNKKCPVGSRSQFRIPAVRYNHANLAANIKQIAKDVNHKMNSWYPVFESTDLTF